MPEACRLCKSAFNPKNRRYKYCEDCRSNGMSPSQRQYRVDWPSTICRLKKHFCKKNGVLFDLQPSDIVVPACCPVLGIKLNFNNSSSNKDDSPSLDRINPSLGYTKNNIAVISMKANRIKNDATLDELQRVVTWLRVLTL